MSLSTNSPAYQEPMCAIIYVPFTPEAGESYMDWEDRLKRTLKRSGFRVDDVQRDDISERVHSLNQIPGTYLDSRPGANAGEGSNPSALTNSVHTAEKRFPRYFEHNHTGMLVRFETANNGGQLLGWPEGTQGPSWNYVTNNPKHYHEITSAEAAKAMEADL